MTQSGTKVCPVPNGTQDVTDSQTKCDSRKPYQKRSTIVHHLAQSSQAADHKCPSIDGPTMDGH